MKKILIAATTLFAMTSAAGWTTSVYTAKVSSNSEIQSIISKINSGRIHVHGCNGDQEVYAYSIKEGGNSFVKTADGGFRPVGTRATFKVRCQE